MDRAVRNPGRRVAPPPAGAASGGARVARRVSRRRPHAVRRIPLRPEPVGSPARHGLLWFAGARRALPSGAVSWDPPRSGARRGGVTPRQGFVHASGFSASAETCGGSSADATSASVTPSRICRTLARTAIHSGSSDRAGPV